MNLIKPIPLKNGTVITEIQCYENGSFTLVGLTDTQQSFMRIFDTFGEIIHSIINLEEGEYCQGIALSFRYFLIFRKNSEGLSQGTLYNADSKICLSGITGYQLFANGWYVLRIADENILYNDNHQKMASAFDDIKMFTSGYALCTNAEFFPDKWILYRFDGTEKAQQSQIKDFIGDGNIIKFHADELRFQIMDWKEHSLTRLNIKSYEKKQNGQFVLSYLNGGRQLFTPNGTPKSVVVVDDADFLSNGQFFSVVDYGKQLYKSNGILDKTEVTSYENLGDLYILSTDNEQGILFDCNGERLGVGYEKYAICGRFALLEYNQSEVELFYNNRKLWSEVI